MRLFDLDEVSAVEPTAVTVTPDPEPARAASSVAPLPAGWPVAPSAGISPVAGPAGCGIPPPPMVEVWFAASVDAGDEIVGVGDGVPVSVSEPDDLPERGAEGRVEDAAVFAEPVVEMRRGAATAVTSPPPAERADFVMVPLSGATMPTTLSPSRANAWLECPRKGVLSRLDKTPVPEGEIDTLLWAGQAGTWVHAILEALMNHRPPQRTRELAEQLFIDLEPELRATSEWERLALPTVDDVTRFDEQVRSTVAGLFDLWDPQGISVIATELPLNVAVDGVPTACVADLVHHFHVGRWNRFYAVTDWKTGAKPKERFFHRATGEYEVTGYDHQIRWYVAAVAEVLGVRPTHGQLVYPKAGVVQRVRVTESDVQGTVDTYAAVWDEITSVYQSILGSGLDVPIEAVPAKPTALCGWCDYLPLCDDGQHWLRTEPFLGKWLAKPANADRVCPATETLSKLDDGWVPVVAPVIRGGFSPTDSNVAESDVPEDE